MKLPNRISFYLTVISGLLAALAFSTHSTGWLIWFAFIPWFYVLFQHCPDWKDTAFFSFIFGLSFYIGMVHWLQELHPLTWLGISTEFSYLIAYGSIPIIAFTVSLWILLFGIILGLLKPQGPNQVLFPALLWIVMEWLQGLGQVSLPWARLAVSQYQNLYLLQISSVTGHLFIDGLIIAFNAALTLFIIEYAPDSRPGMYWHYPSFKYLAGVMVVIGVVYSFGYSKLSQYSLHLPPNSPVVGVVQGSIPQGQKWPQDPQKRYQKIQEIEQIYMNLSYEMNQQIKTQLIVWPESAVPIRLRQMKFFQDHFRRMSKDTGSALLTGMFDQPNPPKGPFYNAAVLVNQDDPIEQWYYKRQLVPFGEFFPYRSLLEGIPFLGPLIISINPMRFDTTPGLDAGLIKTPVGLVGPLICFESVYSHVARDSVRSGAHFLAIVTNDGWYRDAIALYQHLAHAVLRAVENNRYVVRAGNTGISAFIAPSGEILAQTLPLKRTFLYHQIPKMSGKLPLTPYTRFGDWIVWFSLVVLGGLLFWQHWQRGRQPMLAKSEEENQA